jgi:lysophospholipase L1-like esterase
MKQILSTLLLIAVGLVISLVAIEAACRVIYARKLDYQIEMSRYAAALKRTSAHYDIGHEHKPSRSAHLMGVDVSINSHGFRGREVALAKPDGVYRVMLLGDSLTLGWGVEADETFAVLLERMLGEDFEGANTRLRAEVINTGVGNYNTDQEVSFFETRGRAFDPDLVILNYFINDAEPTPRQRLPKILKYTYLGMSLWGRLDLIRRLYLTDGDYSNYYADLYHDDQEGWQRAQAALARLARLSEVDDFALLLVLLPELHSVGEEYGFQEIYDRVRGAAERAGVKHVLELAPAFAHEEPESLWVTLGDAHPNAKAHAIIARGIHDYLSVTGLHDGTESRN